MKILLKNIVICQPNGVQNGAIFIEDKKILEVIPTNETLLHGDEEITVIDGKGKLAIPGMIDVHIHGANGFDMMDGTTQSIQAVSKKCLDTGCTGFLVTSVTSSLEKLLKMITATKETLGNEIGAKILGMHLEGPYLAIEKKGMQDPAHLRNPNIAEMEQILAHAEGLIKMVTIAPELPGAIEMIQYLADKEIIVSIAHSNATYEQAQLAFQSGASHITHCFNAMTSIHHRAPGLVTAALENDDVSVQAIIDGIHLHPGIVRLMYKIKGAERMILITDALQAMGVGDGCYEFGGHLVQVKDGIARLEDGTLASSTVTMNEALRLSTAFEIPLFDAIKMGTSSASSLLNETEIGMLATGFDADIILVDEQFSIKRKMLKGQFYDE